MIYHYMQQMFYVLFNSFGNRLKFLQNIFHYILI